MIPKVETGFGKIMLKPGTGMAAADLRNWGRIMFANLPTWTTDRVDQLKAHFAAGLSCREIAVRSASPATP